jgi:hypothetical protein
MRLRTTAFPHFFDTVSPYRPCGSPSSYRLVSSKNSGPRRFSPFLTDKNPDRFNSRPGFDDFFWIFTG